METMSQTEATELLEAGFTMQDVFEIMEEREMRKFLRGFTER